MERIKKHKTGKSDVLYFDLSNFRNNDEYRKLIAEAKEIISGYDAKSVYTITNITGVLFDSETKEIAAEWMAYNEPYVVNAAIVGVDGIKKMMMQAILKLSGRTNTLLCYTKEDAYAWFESL